VFKINKHTLLQFQLHTVAFALQCLEEWRFYDNTKSRR